MFAPVELPPGYYLEHFRFLLTFLEQRCPALLGPDDRAFIADFRALSRDAQCLYLRLAQRKPRVFRVNKLRYPEIEALDDAVEGLRRAGFARDGEALVEEAPEELMAAFTRAELGRIGPEPTWRRLRRAGLVAELLAWDRLPEALRRLCAREPIIVQERSEDYRRLCFLFFGDARVAMEQFVMRDLGTLQVSERNEDALTPAFRDRQEFIACWEFTCFYESVKQGLREDEDPEAVYRAAAAWMDRRPDPPPRARRIADRLFLRCGRALERAGRPETALEAYARSARPPARERRVRLLAAEGRAAEARALAETMRDRPINADERVFAAHFLPPRAGGRAGRVRETTRRLRCAEAMVLDPAWKSAVEEGAAEWYRAQGRQALHVENRLWRSLLGLLCWEEIADAPGAWHHPLQAAPLELSVFLRDRRDALRRSLEALDAPGAPAERLAATRAAHHGLSHPLVHWQEYLQPALDAVAEHLSPASLRAVLLEMCENLSEHGRGFPDLVVWSDTACSFVEIKSPTDALSPRQWAWLEFMEGQGLDARLVRVTWAVPDGTVQSPDCLRRSRQTICRSSRM